MPKFSFNIPWTKFYALLLVFALLSVAAYSSYSHLQSLYYERVEQNLKSQIGTLHQSLSAWGRSKRSYVYSWARQPELIRDARIITEGKNESLIKLSGFSLVDYLRPVISDPEIRHFYLVGPGNNILATDRSGYMGLTTPLTAFPYLLKQAWGGLTVITHPARFMGEDHSAIYVAAAVKDATSKPVALLVFEVDPTVSFNQVFHKSSFSETGEAYAFNREGIVLTPGRGDLEDFLPAVELSGGTLLGKLADRRPAETKKTPLAGKVGSQNFGIYVREPFQGRDGKRKIGAWIWEAQFQMGLALEQSAEEGLKLLRKMQWTFLSFLGLVVLISLSFFFILSYWSAARSREEEQARKILAEELQAVHEHNTLEIADREAKHRAIIDTAWDAIFTVDSQGVILSGNPATTRIFGCQQDKLVGHLLEDSIWLDGRERLTADYLASASGQEIEATGIRADRRAIPVAVSISQTQTSQAAFFTVIVRDISEQKASEKSLLNAQKRLEMSQSFAFIGTWEWEIRTDQVMATEMALRLNGLDPDRGPVGLGIFFSRLQADDRSELNRAIHTSISTQESFSIECRIENDDRQVEWLLIQGNPLQNQDVVTRIIGHIQRVTERKASEKTLLATRNMLRLVLDTIPIGVYWKGADLKIAGVNRKYCEDVDLPEEAIIGKSERDIYVNRDQAALVENLDRTVVETGLPTVSGSGRYYMNNGKMRYIEISRLPILDQDHQTLGMLGVYTDVTERLETQKSLKRHHKLLASIYTSQLRYFAGDDRRQIFSTLLDEVLSLADSEYGFIGQVLRNADGSPYLKTYSITDIAWNEETKALFQRVRDEGMEFHNLDTLFGYSLKTGELLICNDPSADTRAGGLPPGHPDMNAFMGVPLMKGEQMVGMIGLANRPNGYDHELVRFLQPMFTTCANLIAAIDSDARIAATQQQLLRAKDSAEKANRAKTEFLSRVSHELRTPMNAILGFTGLLSDSVVNEEQSGFLDEIQVAGNHLMNLINEVLDLERIEAGRIDLQSEVLSLDPLIEACCSVTQQLAAQRDIAISMDPQSLSGLSVFADAGRLRQILLNLLSNAIKYNRSGGQVFIKVYRSGESAVCIDVRDTGVGMNENELSHLFESFNRLHAENSDIEGTGMGLVITRQLAELMKGRLSVESIKGEGSCFTLCLPTDPENMSEAREGAGTGADHLRVLVLCSGDKMDICCPELEQLLAGCDLEFTDTGIGFLESALQGQYQLLICDSEADDLPIHELLGYLADADLLSKVDLLITMPSEYSAAQTMQGLTEQQLTRIYQHVKGSTPSKLVQELLNNVNRDQNSF